MYSASYAQFIAPVKRYSRDMSKMPIEKILARNLDYLMKLPGAHYPNANALGNAIGMSPNTIRNLLHPERRPSHGEKPLGFPTIDTLQKVAEKLGREVWELLHPDIERSIREREMYSDLIRGEKIPRWLE